MLDEYGAVNVAGYFFQVFGLILFLIGSWLIKKATQKNEEFEKLREKVSVMEVEIKGLSTQLATTNRILNSMNDAFIKNGWKR